MLPVFEKFRRIVVQHLLEMCGVESNDRDVARSMGIERAHCLELLCWAVWLQVLQECNVALSALELHHVAVIVAAVLLNACTSGNIEELAFVLDLAFGLREVFGALNGGKGCRKIRLAKDGSEARLGSNELCMICKLNVQSSALEGEDLLVDLGFETGDLFLFDLAFAKQALNVVVLVDKNVVLSASQLDLGSEFWEKVVNVSMLVSLCQLSLSFALSDDAVYEPTVFDDVGDHGASLFVAIDEGDDDIISFGEVPEQEASEQSTYEWCANERLDCSEVPAIRDKVGVDEYPISQRLCVVVQGSISRFNKDTHRRCLALATLEVFPIKRFQNRNVLMS